MLDVRRKSPNPCGVFVLCVALLFATFQPKLPSSFFMFLFVAGDKHYKKNCIRLFFLYISEIKF